MNLAKIAAIAAMGVGAASSAHALTQTQTFYTGTSPFTTAPATSQNFPFSDVFSVAQFDTSGGATLNSVTITSNGQVTVLSRVTNVSANTDTVSNATANASITLSGAGFNFSQVFSSGGPYGGSVGPGQTVTLGLAKSALSSSSVSTTPSSFAGTGSTPVSVNFNGGAVSASGTGVDNETFFGGSASGLATIIVTYDFNAAPPPPPLIVPEPMSLALLGAGVLGVHIVRRRRA